MKTNLIFLSIILCFSAYGMLLGIVVRHEADPNNYQMIVGSATSGDLKEMQELIAGCDDLNKQREACSEALVRAAFYGYLDVVQCLVQAGADLKYLDKNVRWIFYQRTALMSAALSGHRVVVEYLLQAGADLNQQNKYGWTALVWAAENRQKACCEQLINHLMKIPSDAQKESVYAFLMCMKRLGVVKDVRQHCFKKHLFADIEQVNREKPEQSLAWQEIARIKNDAFRQQLIDVFWPQSIHWEWEISSEPIQGKKLCCSIQ